jgi:spore germination cell wall hydrolase CwlJ-like protein
MPNRVVVAVMAAVGLLSSTLALAEVTDGSARKTLSNAFEAPVLVANNVATPITVEPESQISASTHAADAADSAVQSEQADTLAELVQISDVADEDDADERCLATAIYYEARSESLAGQLAVAHVVLQRSKSGRFPSSLCGVVTQPGQFSFVRGGRLPAIPSNAGQWRTARAIAQIARDGSWANPVQGALFFHAARVSPGWAKERVTRIGGHVFYR